MLRTAAPDTPPTDPPPATPEAAARARLDRHMRNLARLAEIGMEIAEAAGRCALAALDTQPAAGAPDPGLTYARVARAVRMTIALEARLAADLAALDRDEARLQTARDDARRARVHGLVERAIEAEHGEDEDTADRLSEDAWENLRDPDEYADIAARPIGETVARICKDLGLSPDWSAWAGEAWAAQAEAAQVPHPRSGGLRVGADNDLSAEVRMGPPKAVEGATAAAITRRTPWPVSQESRVATWPDWSG